MGGLDFSYIVQRVWVGSREPVESEWVTESIHTDLSNAEHAGALLFKALNTPNKVLKEWK